VEARGIGIGEPAVKAAILATGARTVGGRLTLNGHAFDPVPADDPERVKPDDRVALRMARFWVRKVLADGPRPEAEVARRLAEMGLAHLLQPAAERLGVRCRQGQ
jgi:hypothetical protein